MSKTRIAFVTGSEGFIGTRLTSFLLSKGWEVGAGTRLSGKQSSIASPRLHPVLCDLRDCERVAQVLREQAPTHVFHLGAESHPALSWADPVQVFASNIMGSLHLFEAIRQLKRPPVVVTACSSAEYGHVRSSCIPVGEDHPLRPVNPYGLSKLCLDFLSRDYYRHYQIRTVALRLFNTTGPGKTMDAPSDFVRQLIRIKKGFQSPILEVGNLKSRRAFLHVDDAVRGLYLAARKGERGEAYNLCANRLVEIGTLLNLAINLSGVKARVRCVPRLVRLSDEKTIFGCSDKFRKATGWKPTISLEQTLRAMLAYWDRTYVETPIWANGNEPFGSTGR
jgi:GDP-4-dehydro-6-deoxy-D-mannose reductase